MRNPSMASMSFNEQYRMIAEECYAYTDGFVTEMTKLGHEVMDVISDCDPLQFAWARENGLTGADYNREMIILSQIVQFKPDIIYLQDIHGLNRTARGYIRKLCPSVKLIVTHKGFPSPETDMAYLDVLLLGFPSLRDRYRAVGLNAHLLYHGFNDQVLTRLERRYGVTTNQRPIKASFSGISGYLAPTHRERYWFLVNVLREGVLEAYMDEKFIVSPDQQGLTDLQIAIGELLEMVPANQVLDHMRKMGLIGDPEQATQISRLIQDTEQRRYFLKTAAINFNELPGTDLLPLRAAFANQCREEVFGLEMYRIMQQSLITLNRHTEAMPDSIGNLRMFQGTGVGACMLTDFGSNLKELFAEDSEVVTYRSPAECVEKLRYLLEHPDEASRIGQAGQRRTLKDHTLKVRCEMLNEILANEMRYR